QPEANHSVTFSTNFGNLGGNSNTQIVKTDKDGRATVKLTSGVAGNAVVSAKVSEVNTEVKAPEVKFFSVLSIDSNVSIIGTSANGALPNIWLRYGQFKLTAKGGDGKYQWRSQDPSVASVDALTGRVTLLKKGTTTIEVVSGDNQTAMYTINTPTKFISVETQNKVVYSDAEATCRMNNARLPSSTSELKDVYNKWGAANSYEGYKGKKTITAWTQQTEDDKQKGWTSTFDIVTKNEIPSNGSNSKVHVNKANAFAVCVR
ncbi:intimin C-type lectin domain-containing protein, partial [Escherichia coli]